MAEEITPMADAPPIIIDPGPLPEPPPPPRVGPPWWNWGLTTKQMVGGEYDVGIGSNQRSA